MRRRGQLLGGDYPRRLAVLSGNSSRPRLVGVTDMDAGIGCSRISPLARYRPGRISTECWTSSGTRPRRQWEFDCVGGALSGWMAVYVNRQKKMADRMVLLAGPPATGKTARLASQEHRMMVIRCSRGSPCFPIHVASIESGVIIDVLRGTLA